MPRRAGQDAIVDVDVDEWVINLDLHPAQREVWESKRRFKIVAAGRRFGKTVLGAATLIVSATEKGRSTGMWVSPTHDQSRMAMDMVAELIPRQYRSVNRTLSEIRLPNGSIMLFRSGDRWDHLRGRGLTVAVLDEAAFMPEAVWTEAVRPALSDHKGHALLISTFNGENWFWKRYRDAQDPDNEEWEGFRYLTVDNPFIDPAEVEEARRSLPREVFEQEYEASPMAFAGAVFDSQRIEEAFDAGRDFTIPEPRFLRPSAPGVPIVLNDRYPAEAGLDWGWLYTALEINIELPDGRIAWVGEKVYERLELNERCEHIARMCRDYNVQTVYADAAGASENVTLARILERAGVQTYVQPVPFNVFKKVGIQTRAYYLERGREILTPACPMLRSDSKAYHYDEAGEKPAKGDDHTVDAATAFYASRASALGDLFEPREGAA